MTCTSTGISSRPPAGALRSRSAATACRRRPSTGRPRSFDKLTVEAAEYVYSKSQPARWATYLANVERYEEAIASGRTAIASADPAERPGLLNSWAIAIQSSGGSIREALALFRAAVKLQPDFWAAHANVQNDSHDPGRRGGRVAGRRGYAQGGRRPPRAGPGNQYIKLGLPHLEPQAWLDATVADAEAERRGGNGCERGRATIADIQARLHDPEAADLALKTTKEDPHDPTIAAMTHFVRGRLAAEAGDRGYRARRWKRMEPPTPILPCPPTIPATTAGSRRPRKRRGIRRRPMRC